MSSVQIVVECMCVPWENVNCMSSALIATVKSFDKDLENDILSTLDFSIIEWGKWRWTNRS